MEGFSVKSLNQNLVFVHIFFPCDRVIKKFNNCTQLTGASLIFNKERDGGKVPRRFLKPSSTVIPLN